MTSPPPLYPYQEEGARFLASRTRALLADTMGLGKTAQAIRACDPRSSVLVVCPASVVENWRREFRIWRPEGIPHQVVSYDKLARTAAETLDVFGPWHTVILDEAHYLKNPKAKRTRAIFGPKCDGVGGIIEGAERVYALTGTPAPNNPAEMWPMLRAMAPNLIEGASGKPMSLDTFTRRYCVTKLRYFGGNAVEQVIAGKNLDELRERIAPFVLRRKKEEVLKDLPEIRFGEITLAQRNTVLPTIPGDEADLLRKTLAEHGAEGIERIAPQMSTLRRLTGLAKATAAAEWAEDWLRGCDEKLVLFAQHTTVIDYLANALHLDGVANITGSTPSAARGREVDRFQTDPKCRVFIGQIQAAGTGITLTAASNLVFVEQSWVPADNVQAAMRIHRIGQKRGCLVQHITLEGSIDEAVDRVLARKTKMLSELFG